MKFWCMVIVAVVAFLAGPASADDGQVTAEEYALYMDWVDGRQDPRLEKFSEDVKLKKIARSLRVKSSRLKAAITKVTPLADTLSKRAEKSLRQNLDATPLKERVIKVIVDTTQGHVVAYVNWRCGDPRDRDKEAAYAGWAIGQGSKVVKTGGVWCVNEIDTKLFSAKIARSAAARINKAAIERFATGRYIRLFEEVKRGPHK